MIPPDRPTPTTAQATVQAPTPASTPAEDAAARRRRELGDFIRARREAISPASVGLPAGGRRRTPGLRREEAATLAGVSATWLTWLEQGRDIALSPAALDRIARALALGRAQRVYLFELAGRRDPAPDLDGGRNTTILPHLSATLHAAVAAIDGPAYALDRCWRVLACNADFADLFPGCPEEEDNFLRYVFLHPAPRRLVPDWEARARRALAEFRLDSSAHLEDPAVRDLVAALARRSPLFAQAWASHAVLAREGGARDFLHPRHGPRRYQQLSFILAPQPDVRLVMLVPVPPGG